MNFINFWFFKQFYYSIRKLFRHKILVLIIFGIIIYFLIQSKVFAVNSTTVPQVVLNKAYELQHNYDNYVVLQDYYTKEYYIPYNLANSSVIQTSSWTVRTINDTYALVAPGYNKMGLKVYRNNTFIDIPSSSFNSSGLQTNITINYNGRLLQPVYYSPPNNIQYVNATGHLNYDTFFSSTYRPYITNRDTIPSWSFNRLLINSDGIDLSFGDIFLDFEYQSNTYSININNYFLIDETTDTQYITYFQPTKYFSVPVNLITNLITLEANTTIRFYLRVSNNGFNTSYPLSSYGLTITEQEATDINNSASGSQGGRIDNNTQQINDSINNSDIDFQLTNLPHDHTNNITADGLDGIFTMIYNAFCNGTAQPLVFPIPFTRETIYFVPWLY